MKKHLLWKSILISLAIFLASMQFVAGQALLVENFEYPNGALLTSNGWTAHSGAGTNAIDVVVPGLTFTGYPGSEVAGAAQVDNTGEDDNRTFTEVSSGAVYVAFLFKVNAIADGYFLHLGQTTIGTTFMGRVFIKTSGSNFTMGLSKSSEAAVYGATLYNTGTTYVGVLKYNIIAGATNDEVSLFVFDSAIPASEPATATIPAFTTTAADINVGSVALRQYSSSQKIIVGGIRVASTWTDAISDVFPPLATFSPSNGATGVAISATPSITFDEPVVKTDGNPMTDADLAALITFKKTDASGENVPFTATINSFKKVITVTPSAALSNSQAYYLSVGAVKDASGNQSTPSSATFTTIAAATPTLTLTYPVGGETVYAGDKVTFTWTSANVTNVNIEVWVPDDVTRVYYWLPIASNIAAADAKYEFTIPTDAHYGTEYKIRLSDASNSSVNSTSGAFTLIAYATDIANLRQHNVVNDIVKLASEVVMSFKRATGNQKYIQDSGSGLLIYDPSAVLTTPLNIGDKFTGLEGKLATYGGVLEIVPTKASVTVTSTGNTITAPELSLTEYFTNYATYESRLIVLKDVHFPDATGAETFAAATNYNLSDYDNVVTFRTFAAGESDIIGWSVPVSHVKMTCIAGFYTTSTTTVQVYARTRSDFEFITTAEKVSSDAPVIYPVPAKEVLTIRNLADIRKAEILDASGRVIRSENPNGGTELSIPVGDLARGIYFLRLTTQTGRVTSKFVK